MAPFKEPGFSGCRPGRIGRAAKARLGWYFRADSARASGHSAAVVGERPLL